MQPTLLRSLLGAILLTVFFGGTLVIAQPLTVASVPQTNPMLDEVFPMPGIGFCHYSFGEHPNPVNAQLGTIFYYTQYDLALAQVVRHKLFQPQGSLYTGHVFSGKEHLFFFTNRLEGKNYTLRIAADGRVIDNKVTRLIHDESGVVYFSAEAYYMVVKDRSAKDEMYVCRLNYKQDTLWKQRFEGQNRADVQLEQLKESNGQVLLTLKSARTTGKRVDSRLVCLNEQNGMVLFSKELVTNERIRVPTAFAVIDGEILVGGFYFSGEKFGKIADGFFLTKFAEDGTTRFESLLDLKDEKLQAILHENGNLNQANLNKMVFNDVVKINNAYLLSAELFDRSDFRGGGLIAAGVMMGFGLPGIVVPDQVSSYRLSNLMLFQFDFDGQLTRIDLTSKAPSVERVAGNFDNDLWVTHILRRAGVFNPGFTARSSITAARHLFYKQNLGKENVQVNALSVSDDGTFRTTAYELSTQWPDLKKLRFFDVMQVADDQVLVNFRTRKIEYYQLIRLSEFH